MALTYQLGDYSSVHDKNVSSTFSNLTQTENGTLSSSFGNSPWLLVAESLLCCLMTLIVILFSTFSLVVFFCSPRHLKSAFHKPAGFIMIWLSVNDFITGFSLLLPMTVTVISGHDWLFGRSLCIVQGLVLQLIQNSTNALLTWAAIDRFCALVLPIRYIYWVSRLTKRGYFMFCTMILIYSCLFPVCNIAIYQSMFFDRQLLCFIYSPSLLFICSNFIVNALLPLLIMTACYSLVIVTLCHKKHNNSAADQEVCVQPNNGLQAGYESGRCTPSPLHLTLSPPSPIPTPALIGAPVSVASNLTTPVVKPPGSSSTPSTNGGRRHVSVARAREENQLIKRVFKLFFIITIIFTLTWIPYMTVDFYYGGMAPPLVYRISTYLIFTTSVTNFPLFLAYNRKFRTASVVLIRLILRLDKDNAETATRGGKAAMIPAHTVDRSPFAHKTALANTSPLPLGMPGGRAMAEDQTLLHPRILITPDVETPI